MPELSLVLLIKLAACFLLGSIPFAIVSMWGTGVDITTYGSGNPGFNNVLRYSKWRSVICLAGDAGKGLLAILLFSTSEFSGWLCGLAAVAGHCYSPFLKFRGGKGLATAAGVMLYLHPLILLPCVAWYIVWRIIGAKLNWTERGAIASLTASLLFVVQLLVFHSLLMASMGLLLLAFIAIRHKKNFENLGRAAKSH